MHAQRGLGNGKNIKAARELVRCAILDQEEVVYESSISEEQAALSAISMRALLDATTLKGNSCELVG